MELVKTHNIAKYQAEEGNITFPNDLSSPGIERFLEPLPINNQFVKANTIDISLTHLKKDCIIPVFAKDNEQTISHFEFIELAISSIEKIFPGQKINIPEIRVSHMVKGRTPDAVGLTVKELKDNQRTIYYERMAFILTVPGIRQNVNGNDLILSIGGVRAYNHENLYGKKGIQKFKFFIGFENLVCCNLCISTDGYKSELKALSTNDLFEEMVELINNYQMDEHLKLMKSLEDVSLSENQFAHLMGKTKLYQYLPTVKKKIIPDLLLNDNHFSAVAKDYYRDKSFCKSNSGDINLWKVYNLLTGANKSSYIDTFLDRGVNAFEFTQGISKAINGDSQYRWFLS